MDHSLTLEISESMPEPKTHAMQKAPVSLSLSLSLKSLRKCPSTPQTSGVHQDARIQAKLLRCHH